jgi:D-glycero-alpha-D-manno-heptose 1-phosphate guanylyltransferase
MEAIVLAGGLGTRLRGLVSDVPKPMAPVNGRPFLEILLEYWIGQGVRRFVLSIGYLAECVVRHFGSGWRGVAIEYAREDVPLGTGGGLLLAAQQARETDLLVLNGDSFFGVQLAGLVACHRERLADCSLSLFRSLDVERYLGVELGEHGEVRSLAARAGPNGALVNGGVYLFRAAALRRLPWRAGQSASLEADVLPHALHSGWRIFGLESGGTFVDIGVPHDYQRAGAILQG